jgi:hypothetical protein
VNPEATGEDLLVELDWDHMVKCEFRACRWEATSLVLANPRPGPLPARVLRAGLQGPRGLHEGGPPQLPQLQRDPDGPDHPNNEGEQVSEFPVQVTIKGPATISQAPWLNFQGQSVDEVKEQILEVFPGTEFDSFAELVSKVYVEYGAVLSATVGLAAPVPLRRPRFRARAPRPSGPLLRPQRPTGRLLRPSASMARRCTARVSVRTGPGRPGSAPRPRARPVSARRSSCNADCIEGGGRSR